MVSPILTQTLSGFLDGRGAPACLPQSPMVDREPLHMKQIPQFASVPWGRVPAGVNPSCTPFWGLEQAQGSYPARAPHQREEGDSWLNQEGKHPTSSGR